MTSIYYSTKLHMNAPDAFKSLEQGTLGTFLAGQPYYFFGAGYPTRSPYFAVSGTEELPSAAIFFAHRECFLEDDMLGDERGGVWRMGLTCGRGL